MIAKKKKGGKIEMGRELEEKKSEVKRWEMHDINERSPA